MARQITTMSGAAGGSGMFANLAASPGKLTPAQSRRRMIRQKLAEAAGLVKPGEVFHAYGPNKTQGADQLLKGGSGFGKGLGAAQHDTQRALMQRRRKGGAAGGKPLV